jgi:hypothetical protein
MKEVVYKAALVSRHAANQAKLYAAPVLFLQVADATAKLSKVMPQDASSRNHVSRVSHVDHVDHVSHLSHVIQQSQGVIYQAPPADYATVSVCYLAEQQ